jgi:ribosomal protein S9
LAKKRLVGWGRGKRKKAIALAKVVPGTGMIRVNGKPLTKYFHLPTQRWRMMKPVILAEKTCLVHTQVTIG